MCSGCQALPAGRFMPMRAVPILPCVSAYQNRHHHTWRSYVMFLLDVMPERTAEHYRNKIAVLNLRWYQTRGFPGPYPG
ncbi:DUF3440 domain-containing protein [Escherichia coli]